MDTRKITESKVLSLLSKLREIQKANGIQNVKVKLVRKYKYIVYHFKEMETTVKIIANAPTKIKQKLWKFESDCNVLGLYEDVPLSVSIELGMVGYPLECHAPFLSFETNSPISLDPKPNLLLLILRQDHLVYTNSSLSIFFSQNKSYADSFRVVCCIMDSLDPAGTKKTISEECPKSFEYTYISPSEWRGNLPVEWDKPVPMYLLVDSQKIVRKIRPVEHAKLQKDIKEFIEGKAAPTKRTPSMELMREIEQFAESRTDILIDACTGLLSTFTAITAFNLHNGQIVEKVPKLEANAENPDWSNDLVCDIIGELQTVFNKKVRFSTMRMGISCISVKAGPVCNKCGINIEKKSQFICTECETGYYLCEKCGRKCEEVLVPKDLPHRHPLYYVKEEVGSNSLRKILYNGEEARKLENILSVKCGFCKEDIQGVKWICLNCSIKLCNKCFYKSKAEDDTDIIEELNRLGHKQASHILCLLDY